MRWSCPYLAVGPKVKLRIPHQLNDINTCVGASGPQTAEHQRVVQYVAAYHVEGVAAIDPLLDEIGFRR
jgi:hypothetical protein